MFLWGILRQDRDSVSLGGGVADTGGPSNCLQRKECAGIIPDCCRGPPTEDGIMELEKDEAFHGIERPAVSALRPQARLRFPEARERVLS